MEESEIVGSDEWLLVDDEDEDGTINRNVAGKEDLSRLADGCGVALDVVEVGVDDRLSNERSVLDGREEEGEGRFEISIEKSGTKGIELTFAAPFAVVVVV